MPEPVPIPINEPEASKRRSTRIVQAVPLTVIGVDALGRPFQERTSTLIINCHGCRYQSKHYVLKNMWVTFEVPHEDPGHPPRTVRARVMWIQRPRTVRELFQVGVELEVTGNFWGVAFPPSDWFPFPEGPAAPSLPVPTTPSLPSPESPVDNFLRECNQSMAESAQRAVHQLASELDKLEKDHSAAFERSLEKQVLENLERLQKQAADVYPQVPPESPGLGHTAQFSNPGAEDLEQRIRAQIEQAQASLSEMESASRQLREQAASALSSIQTLEQRANALLEAQSAEMTRRAEGALGAWAERLPPALETAGQQALTRLTAEIKSKMKDSIENAAAMVTRLERAIASAEEALRRQQENLTKESEQAIQFACERVKLAAEFRTALKLQVQDELDGARKELLAQLTSAQEQLGLESEAQRHKIAESATGLNDEAMEDYKRRLEAASNSWLLTTVSKLSQQSEQHVQVLTKAAEERLRAACTEIFSGVGDALRRGLLDASSLPLPPRKTRE